MASDVRMKSQVSNTKGDKRKRVLKVVDSEATAYHPYSGNVGMSAKTKAEEKHRRMGKTDGMVLVCIGIKAQN